MIKSILASLSLCILSACGGGNSPLIVKGTDFSFTPGVTSHLSLDVPDAFYADTEVDFSFTGNNYFTQNAGAGQSGHFGVVTRSNLAQDTANKAILGEGVIAGNVSGATATACSTPNQQYPSMQIEEWFNNLTPGNCLLAGNPGSPILQDGHQYDIKFYSHLTQDRSLQTVRYTISENGNLLYDSGTMNDANTQFSITQNQVWFGQVLENSAATPWSINFSNIVGTFQ